MEWKIDLKERPINGEFASSHILQSALTETERTVLEIVNKQLLISEGELVVALHKEGLDGADSAIHRLKESEFLKTIEPVGGTCYVITQKGMKALKA